MSPSIQQESFENEIATMDDDRTGIKVETLKRAILENLRYVVGKDPEFATEMDYFMAVAYTVRDRILARWLATRRNYSGHDVRLVCYLSAEFLMGPQLANNLLNLGVEDAIRQATKELGLDLNRIVAEESEPGLGNGGLGRLAACYLDSLATLGIPAIGYGIRYEFGMFHQEIRDGWQVELTDYWLRYGNPWEIRRPQAAVDVLFGGHTESWTDSHGALKTRWIPASLVKGIPYDTPVLGYASGVANDLRLWKSEAGESFYFDKFKAGTIKARLRRRTSRRIFPRCFIPTTKG
jgi:glycogen phosphorylase